MKQAFSLVELSIVLVILGLLTGGILAGQSLIRASELRAISTEYNNYITTFRSFRDKYMALPGDIKNAHLFWGARDGGDGYGSDCRSEVNSSGTCSGNGNGQIIGYDGVDPDASSYTYENYLLWDHLARAGLVTGTYTGNPATRAGNTVCVDAANGSIPGCNAPRSKFGSSNMWQINRVGNVVSHPYLFDGTYGHALTLTRGPGWNNFIDHVMRPDELLSLDTKMDDGKPGTGKLIGARWNTCTIGAASTADAALAEYYTNLPAWVTDPNRCLPVFREAL